MQLTRWGNISQGMPGHQRLLVRLGSTTAARNQVCGTSNVACRCGDTKTRAGPQCLTKFV